jgi:ATP-dependent DNA helicase RecQ
MAFDFAEFLQVCAYWPARLVSEAPAGDPLLERIRQVLVSMQRRPSLTASADLIPLFRSAMLRRSADGANLWVRVPLGPDWPSSDDWLESQFTVLEEPSWVTLSARPPRVPALGIQEDVFDDAFMAVPARHRHLIAADPALARGMVLPTYTGEGQREAVRALFHLPARDTLIANLPTGSGKSLLAHLPPLIAAEGKLTLAVVPTVALAIDQARRLEPLLAQRRRGDLPPLAYHGGLTTEERQQVWRALGSGSQPVLFTSPEHATGSLRRLLEAAAAAGWMDEVFIDEAHLVIGWGNGFRPAFQLLPALVADLRRRSGTADLRVVLASATLTASTTRVLRQLFGPADRTYVVAAVHLRAEPRYAVRHFPDEHSRTNAVLEALRLAPRPFILYVTRPEEAESWLQRLRTVGFGRLDMFTGQTPALMRKELLQRWERNELDGMIATSAFGLGVEKSDVRVVIHATLPESLDRFYQEVGRSGRDGLASASLVFYTDEDWQQAKSMSGDKLIRDETGFERWLAMIDYAEHDPDDPSTLWLDLRRLPAHLKQPSDANTSWNVRTLTLMTRAGLIELVALGHGAAVPREIEDEIWGHPTHAAVRILEHDHRRSETFFPRMQAARDQVWRASEEGFKSMSDVAAGRLEISTALARTYSVIGDGVWAPVTRCCGGCSVHWHDRREYGRYIPPSAPRLQRFAARGRLREFLSPMPMARDNLLVIDLPINAYSLRAMQVLRTLLFAVQPHTIALDHLFHDGLRPSIDEEIVSASALRTFVDSVDIDKPYEWDAGAGEVRVFICGPGTRSAPEELWASRAHLEVLLIPETMPHPLHPARRLVDTTPHLHALDFLERFST